jgi:hypothetical protein
MEMETDKDGHQELLNYWYEWQQDEENGIGFQFQKDPNVTTWK